MIIQNRISSKTEQTNDVEMQQKRRIGTLVSKTVLGRVNLIKKCILVYFISILLLGVENVIQIHSTIE